MVACIEHGASQQWAAILATSMDIVVSIDEFAACDPIARLETSCDSWDECIGEIAANGSLGSSMEVEESEMIKS